MSQTSEFVLETDGEVLQGTILQPVPQRAGDDEGSDPGHVHSTVLIMHGAGTASQQRMLPLAGDFARRGRRAAVFDFSGHGRSTGLLPDLSLRRRRDQARAVIDRVLPAKAPLLLLGFSMSGQTVADLVEVYGERVTGVGLFSPAVYDAAAWDVPFGLGFSALIRRPDSWRDTRAFASFAAFQGSAVLVVPEQDDVIPPDVTRLLAETLRGRPGSAYRRLRISGSAHQLGLWLAEHPQDRATVVDALLDAEDARSGHADEAKVSG